MRGDLMREVTSGGGSGELSDHRTLFCTRVWQPSQKYSAVHAGCIDWALAACRILCQTRETQRQHSLPSYSFHSGWEWKNNNKINHLDE